MSDLLDTVSDVIQHSIDIKINSARSKLTQPQGSTYCLNCHEPIKEPGRRFCDKECAEDAAKLGLV